MNRASDATVRMTVNTNTSTNLNSLPEAAATKTRAASAGTNPAHSIRTPNRISENGRRASALSDTLP